MQIADKFEQVIYTLTLIAEGMPKSVIGESRRRALYRCADLMGEAAIGHARYEKLRKLQPSEYVKLCKRNLAGEKFDEMVDQLSGGGK